MPAAGLAVVLALIAPALPAQADGPFADWAAIVVSGDYPRPYGRPHRDLRQRAARRGQELRRRRLRAAATSSSSRSAPSAIADTAKP